MTKEIGGYLELDRYHLPMLHDEAIALNSGRNCLAYLIRKKGIKRIWIPKGVTYILKDTFKGCNNLEEIYYEGSMEDFKKIDVYYKLYKVIPKLGLQDEIEEYYDLGNLPFINAKVYYNQVRDMEKTSEYLAEIGKVDIKNIFKNKWQN